MMVRGFSIFFGLSLGALFIIGLATSNWAGWLTWLDLVAAVIAVAGTAGAGAPIAVSIGVLILWIIGLATGAQPTQVWWNFIVGVVYLFSEIAAVSSARPGETSLSPQWRESA